MKTRFIGGIHDGQPTPEHFSATSNRRRQTMPPDAVYVRTTYESCSSDTGETQTRLFYVLNGMDEDEANYRVMQLWDHGANAPAA